MIMTEFEIPLRTAVLRDRVAALDRMNADPFKPGKKEALNARPLRIHVVLYRNFVRTITPQLMQWQERWIAPPMVGGRVGDATRSLCTWPKLRKDADGYEEP